MKKIFLSTQLRYRIAVSSFFFIQGIVFASWASRIPDIKKALNLSDAMLGGVLLSIPVGQMCAMALSGWLVARYGSRKMLTLAAILYPAFLVNLGFSRDIWRLIIGLFLFGMAGNLSNISVNTQGVDVERLYHKRSIMASFHGLWSLAGFLGGLISTLMVGYNIKPGLHFVIIFALTTLILLYMRRATVPRDFSAADRPSSDGKENKKVFTMPDKYIIMLGFIAFACMACEGTMYDWSGVYFQSVVDAPKNLIRLGYTAYMCTMALGRFTADGFVNRFGAVPVIKASGLIMFSGLIISVLFPSIGAATFGFLLVGFGTSSVVPLCYSMAGRSKVMKASVALATVSTIGFLGFLMGPPVIGFIAQAWGLKFSFALVALVGLMTTFIAPHLKHE